MATVVPRSWYRSHAPHGPCRSVVLATLAALGCAGPGTADAPDVTPLDTPATDASATTMDGAVAPEATASDAAVPTDIADITDITDITLAPADVTADASTVGRSDVPVEASDVPPACRTRVTYGNAWMRPPGHPEAWDDAEGAVTWDGVCSDDGANSHAVLSNGWRPYFFGHGRCDIALDAAHCAGTPAECATRYTYGPTWHAPPGHAARFDDVGGFASWDGVCHRDGPGSLGVLSNGWQPHFTSTDCAVSVRRTQCGPGYVNPVLGGDCPDPGVLQVGADYYVTCTSGNAPDAFPIRTSRDLVHWTSVGSIFPAGHRPTWAASDFWAPEIHRVGGGYVAYYTARRAGGQLAVGAASAPSPTGPFTDLGRPLLYDPAMGLIDPTMFQSADGTMYVYWKEDGNAVGRSTPIHGQRLGPDGLSVTGPAPTVITNDLPWEGAVVEGPWLTAHDGTVYLFYSANAYNTGRYAVGVARAIAPLGPFTKHGSPILVSSSAFAGPGHGAVTATPSGATAWVYHAWRAGFVAGPGDGRELLVDTITWAGGWPSLPGAPSSTVRPPP